VFGRKVWGKVWPSLGCADELGRKWTKPSDILENPELQKSDSAESARTKMKRVR
jgi:hypothetical protein